MQIGLGETAIPWVSAPQFSGKHGNSEVCRAIEIPIACWGCGVVETSASPENVAAPRTKPVAEVTAVTADRAKSRNWRLQYAFRLTKPCQTVRKRMRRSSHGVQ